jgi:hypothetical protein
MMHSILLSVFFAFALVANIAAHANHNLEEERELRRVYLDGLENKALEHCTVKLKQNGLEKRIIERRQRLANHLRKRSLQNEHHGA